MKLRDELDLMATSEGAKKAWESRHRAQKNEGVYQGHLARAKELVKTDKRFKGRDPKRIAKLIHDVAHKTLASYIKSQQGKEYEDSMGRPTAWGKGGPAQTQAELRNAGYLHRSVVEQAFELGFKIPSHVLKNYPDLQKRKA